MSLLKWPTANLFSRLSIYRPVLSSLLLDLQLHPRGRDNLRLR